MLAIELKDLNFFRHMLHVDIEKWNRSVERYIKELYPDAEFMFSQRDQCWKAMNTDIVYYVDVELILTSEKYGFCWTDQNQIRRIHTVNGILLRTKTERAKYVSFGKDDF
jgi:hypothetical protein